MTTIPFTTPLTVVLRPQSTIPEISENLSAMEVVRMIDSPAAKKVVVELKGPGNSKYRNVLTLWEGPEYDAIGQWTDTDVSNRIKEIYNIT